jgi:hypothetical protein
MLKFKPSVGMSCTHGSLLPNGKSRKVADGGTFTPLRWDVVTTTGHVVARLRRDYTIFKHSKRQWRRVGHPYRAHRQRSEEVVLRWEYQNTFTANLEWGAYCVHVSVQRSELEAILGPVPAHSGPVPDPEPNPFAVLAKLYFGRT